MNYIARRRPSDNKEQSLIAHLNGVGEKSAKFAQKIQAPNAGLMIGLLHDFGKYSNDFQNYINSATGNIEPDEDDYINPKGMKGKIDHSTAGAQWIWQFLSNLQNNKSHAELCGQILALCIASHHSGLIDVFSPENIDIFEERMRKNDRKSHHKECCKNAPNEYFMNLKNIADINLIKEIIESIHNTTKNEKSDSIKAFNIGFWTRFLFSCLVDADRIDSADFERKHSANFREIKFNWNVAIHRLESHLSKIKSEPKPQNKTKIDINIIRQEISNQCLNRSKEEPGLYSLTIPTGGGKTLASLRYALHHAKEHKLERIIYVIPFTSIIDQNVKVTRKIIEKPNDKHPWILEIHSNLEPENQNWKTKMLSENWDAPIIFTTMVQFLDALFGGGTRSVRRLHQLANSIIIFDEIQSLPINCVHLFNNALNFLSKTTNTTALFCTATQPLLNEVDKKKGRLDIKPENEIAPKNIQKHFNKLNRVEMINHICPQGWTLEQISKLSVDETREKGNCLVIVNTKQWARDLYVQCNEIMHETEIKVFYLSTNLCPQHREEVIEEIKEKIDLGEPILCISTQLIEAGVDIDFASVIRFLAGLDSIIQSAGRCNREGKNKGTVHIVNPNQENISMLKDIKVGRDETQRILSEIDNISELFKPETMTRYFKYYFHNRDNEMDYPIRNNKTRDDNLLNLLSENQFNSLSKRNDIRTHNKKCPLLQQSFMTAGKAFKTIDAPTHAVIVQHGKGEDIIAKLCGIFKPEIQYELLRNAQRYSVNVFPNIWEKLNKAEAIHQIQDGIDIYYLKKEHYHNKFGVSVEVVNSLPFLNY